MRTLVVALLLSAPVAALAQTPGDIARQVWPLGAPSDTSTVRVGGPAHAGAATARDVASFLWPAGSPAPTGVAPESGAVYASSFAAADLARLRGSTEAGPQPVLEAGSYRIAVTGRTAQ